ncbi:MAG: hypothetical protein ACSHWZ_12445 [Sulfitobacter sp.]
MKRRAFLSLIGAAAAAPALPAFGVQGGAAVFAVSGAVSRAAGYNRYLYGLAVFQARTRASLNAADLIARLKVSAPQAQAMMHEMTARGVLSPALGGTVQVARAAAPRAPYLRRALRPARPDLPNLLKTKISTGPAATAVDASGDRASDRAASASTPVSAPAVHGRCTDGAQVAQPACPAPPKTPDTTSCGPNLGVR